MRYRPDEDILRAWEESGHSPAVAAKLLNMTERAFYRRRRTIEQTHGALLANAAPVWKQVFENFSRTSIDTGTVIVFSDAHFWPGQETVGFRALLALIRDLKPRIVFANGDMVDGAWTNRHDAQGFSVKPTVKQEFEATDAALLQVRMAAPKGCQFFWNVGNHDLNFERRIIQHLPQYADMPMVRLKDHFPDWSFQWATEINGSVIVKHRWHNGVHGAYNNAMKSGRTIVTGHLHRLLVTPWSDYNGRRWGVDTGTVADPEGPMFEYTEANPKPWCQGFAVLTFDDGKLAPPELCEVIDGTPWFRGKPVLL